MSLSLRTLARLSVCAVVIATSTTLVACSFQEAGPARRTTIDGDDSIDDDDVSSSEGNAGPSGDPNPAPAAVFEITGSYAAYESSIGVHIDGYPSFPVGTDRANLPRLSGVESTIALPEVGSCSPTISWTLGTTELDANIELDDAECVDFKRGVMREGIVVTIVQAPRASGAPIDVKINLLAN